MSTPIPRYLVPFHPKHVPALLHRRVDRRQRAGRAAGGAGGRSEAVGRRRHQAGRRAIEQLVTLRAASPACSTRTTASRTTWPTRSRPAARSAIADVVERVVREAPQRIGELIDWGTQFDRRATAWPWRAKGARPRPHRPRLRRRHGQGDHAGDDRPRRKDRPTSTSGRTPSRSIC